MNDQAATGTALLDADRRHLIHPLHHPKDHAQARVFVEGRGAMLRTADGTEYIDGLSCLWNVNVGHGRKELADAAAEQMANLAYASAYAGFSNEPAIRLAERIVGLAYDNMAAVYFTTGGAESNESAFKTARYYWKRMGKPNKVKIISRQYGYHGVTLAAMSATSLPGYHKMFGPLVPEFFQVAPPYPYRWPGNGDPGIEAADAAEAAIEAHGADSIAAVIAEPVMGAGGVIVPPATYFPRLRQICDRHNVLLIADEVITGFGRTGRWFALGHWGVEPDLVSFAKGVTSGYLPLGGVIVSKRVHQAMEEAPMDEKFMHAATYSGHPACCAVGLRNIDILEQEALPERASVMGKRLLAGLESLRSLPVVGDVRGLGMMCGVELVEDQATRKPAIGLGPRVVAEAMKRGLIIRQRGGGGTPISGDSLCIAPPLMTPEATLDRLVSIVGESIQAAM
ncbi:MAG TPA: aspartate aminotransferase family protein [Acetobacteraceae bacterium]|jgi:adenosylmethionine-8-amino-7-oxononanoate aminotransferase|nr:aspartate aminotransferase family protein [Acetobacteraceae bacterium]